jgi:hypothetical protein
MPLQSARFHQSCVHRSSSEGVAKVQRSLLANVLRFYESHTIHDWNGMQESTIKKGFHWPLWKLLELDRKRASGQDVSLVTLVVISSP